MTVFRFNAVKIVQDLWKCDFARHPRSRIFCQESEHGLHNKHLLLVDLLLVQKSQSITSSEVVQSVHFFILMFVSSLNIRCTHWHDVGQGVVSSAGTIRFASRVVSLDKR